MLNAGIDNCHASVISLFELYYGAYNAGKESYIKKEVLRVDKLRTESDILPLPGKADFYGRIKVHLRKTGKPVDEFDMIIASQALTEGMTVVADNLKHFKDIEGLNTINWA